VLYGHTHKLDIHQDGKTLIINPGESCGYLTGHSTAVILDPNTKEYEIIRSLIPIVLSEQASKVC